MGATNTKSKKVKGSTQVTPDPHRITTSDPLCFIVPKNKGDSIKDTTEATIKQLQILTQIPDLTTDIFKALSKLLSEKSTSLDFLNNPLPVIKEL
jgi:hypothetical protein